jgi:hypothetical protein
MKTIQNFYKSTLSLDWSIGTGTFYVTTKPTITDGWLVISPNNSTIREIIRYTSTGTDSNGDYVVVSIRGVGGTTEQIHTVGEPIRMNITAEYWKDMTDAIDSIVAAGAPNADTTTKGLVEIATDAEVIAGTATGATGASLVATPAQIKTNYEKIVPIVRTYLNAASPATWTKPAGLKYVVVEVQAGGGNGANGTDEGSRGKGGGGGGAGGYSKKTIAVGTLGATETVTIGAATAASSFGAHATATAGGNGSSDNAGGGGGGSSGDINIYGSDGGNGIAPGGTGTAGGGGTGGTSHLGGGGKGGTGTGGGDTGRVYGGGGGGGGGTDTGAGSGGSGAAGIVIVTEYY